MEFAYKQLAVPNHPLRLKAQKLEATTRAGHHTIDTYILQKTLTSANRKYELGTQEIHHESDQARSQTPLFLALIKYFLNNELVSNKDSNFLKGTFTSTEASQHVNNLCGD